MSENSQTRERDSAPTGPSTTVVEKHKENFLHLHGSFSDKHSENIDRWIEKADEYQAAHMVKSLEMGTIVACCIRGEPAIKIRRMLDVPGTIYKHSNHYSKQPLQEKKDFEPYRDHVPKGPNQEVEILSRPATMAVRAEPEVTEEKCLKWYLLQIYKKKIDMNDAEKFLATFKTQKQKQTCSNFIDQFVIYYENYSCQRWTTAQRALNLPTRDEEMMQLIIHGICNEFKVHCDNTKFELSTAKLEQLEAQVVEWQRSSTTGKKFTSECTQAKLPSAMTSALELADYFTTPALDPTIEEEGTSAAQVSTAASRGQKASRGTRGNNRGAKNGRGRGRGANNSSAGAPRIQIVSRDVMDGNMPNYRQTTEGNLLRSTFGYPICNYCGKPSHKRESCSYKKIDRDNGLTRVNHPDKEKNTTEVTTPGRTPATFPASSAMGTNPYPFGYPIQQPIAPWPPWPGYQPSPAHFIQNHNGPFQQQQVQVDSAEQMDIPRNYNTIRQEQVSSAATIPCPYPTCNIMLSDQNQAMEHIRSFHSINNSLARPGMNT